MKLLRSVWFWLAMVLGLSFCLNVSAFNWGRTGDCTWNTDTIEGRIIAVYLPQLTKTWIHKYPRGHYLVNYPFYKSRLDKWERNPVRRDMGNGRVQYSALNLDRLYRLAGVTKTINIVMSMGILLAVFFTARSLFQDSWVGVLSVLCLALSCHFTFYSKSGGVDIPAFFWFAWACCFGLWAITKDKLICYILAGFCAAWSVCTKEGVTPFHIGLAVALGTMLVWKKRQEGSTWKATFLALVRYKVLIALVVSVLVFVTLEGFWSGAGEWQQRSGFWKGVIEDEFTAAQRSVIQLLGQTYQALFAGWGGPFLILTTVSLVYWLFRYRWQLLLVVLPGVSFVIMVLLVIHQNLPRFMMCAYLGMAVLMGKTLVDWYRWQKVPIAVRHIMPLLVLLPSLVCCVCHNLELQDDPRVRAEQWIGDHAPAGAIVGVSMTRLYAPRIWTQGYRLIFDYDSRGVQTKQGRVRIEPDYLIGSNSWPCRSQSDPDFFKRLATGDTSYNKVAEYRITYFRKTHVLWRCCLRFFRLHGLVPNHVTIYQKQKDS